LLPGRRVEVLGDQVVLRNVIAASELAVVTAVLADATRRASEHSAHLREEGLGRAPGRSCVQA